MGKAVEMCNGVSCSNNHKLFSKAGEGYGGQMECLREWQQADPVGPCIFMTECLNFIP